MQNIDSLIASGQLEEALKAVRNAIAQSPHSYDLLFAEGKILWKMGRRSEAMSSYAKAAEIEPNSAAAAALEHGRSIEAFFNPDLYNP